MWVGVMEKRVNKTIICSVFFLDIIEYSKKSVAEQISLKERFNAFLSIAIANVPVNDRIILDTGDGAAITFLGDIEDALQAAMSERKSLLAEDDSAENKLLLRMGINLGPARLVRDINGQPNIVGDGINVAQRVMGFSEPGQILVSRSYYDAVSRISEEFAGLFHYQGSKTDKHVREHEVYAIGYPGDMQLKRSTVDRRLIYASLIKSAAQLVDRVKGGLIEFVKNTQLMFIKLGTDFVQSNPKNRFYYIALMLAPMLLVWLFVAKMSLKSDHSNPLPAISSAAVIAPSSAVAAASSVTMANKQGHSVKSADPVKSSDHNLKATEKPLHENKEPNRGTQDLNVKAGQTPKTDKETIKKTVRAPEHAVVALGIKPWGEVYLDGKKQGVSPPLTEIEATVGSHEIVIRNTNFPELKKTITLNPGEKVMIKHVFN